MSTIKPTLARPDRSLVTACVHKRRCFSYIQHVIPATCPVLFSCFESIAATVSSALPRHHLQYREQLHHHQLLYHEKGHSLVAELKPALHRDHNLTTFPEYHSDGDN
jgi:hypothetical protein